jgi:hypothetical protein
MLLVLSTNEATESGIAYADVTGVKYEYPRRYRKLVRSGERFVYYRGRRLPGGKTRPQQYFGTGVVGEISKSAGGRDRLICQILDYREFSYPVGLRWSDGTRVEPGGDAGGLFYRTGVRVITEKIFIRLLQVGNPGEISTGAAYATPKSTHDVDAYAMQVAIGYLKEKFLGAAVEAMPHNNPGFDIEVRLSSGQVLVVEVKGTQAVAPRFFMTEGERIFASTNSVRYTLIVVFGIDLLKQTHSTVEQPGDPNDHFVLVPSQWIGLLK